ncbi:MAG: dTDP-glucose 4,6-dehydratase [Hyphomicrobiales bacterium]|nr:dTDP-glucose 4,6-dehydratase [Hyphomicrobiales bacterium]MCA1998550.1 dTDP-glucose 4,6-dehydratase [Hyphomicrobiales bacterium]
MKEHPIPRVLVTGGAGFIGSALCRLLVGEAGIAVLNVDKLTYAGSLAALRAIEDHPSYSFVRQDIADLDAMRRLMADFDPDAVLHLAAESHVDRSIDGARAFVETNVVGTFAMLEAARAHWVALAPARRAAFRFIQVSTDEVYGSLGATGAFDAASPYDPSSPYAATKAAGDHLARAWHRTHGLPVIVTNCSNNYGPFQFPEKLIPLMVLNALEGRPLPVYGAGTQVRDWLHVEDHARALLGVLHAGRPGATYLIGGRAERRNIDVVVAICHALDRLRPQGAPHARLITHVADRPGHDLRYAIDPSATERELGWHAVEDFESGLARTLRWYLDNEWWWRPLRERIYAGERLGAAAPAG